MLRDLLLFFLLTLTMLVALAGAAIAVFSWQLNRSNRVAPDVETLAPLLWLWSPSQPARLHRRLRGAVAPVHVNVPKPVKKRRVTRNPEQFSSPPSATSEFSRTLVEQAVALDHHVVASARLPRPQRRMQMRSLQMQVTEVERLSARIVHHERRVAAEAYVPGSPVPTPPAVLADLSQQLDVLDAAHQELRAIEQANGLLDPDALMRQRAVQPPPQAVPRAQPPAPRAVTNNASPAPEHTVPPPTPATG